MPSPDYSLMSVLVVDDEQFSLSIVTRLVKSIGFGRVFKATDGREALELLSDKTLPRIDVVICDFNMPRQNGLQVLQRVRRGDERAPRETPFLMLTGNADKELVGTAIALDVDAFIVKPVSKGTLEGRIVRVLNNRPKFKSEAEYRSITVPESLQAITQAVTAPVQAVAKGPANAKSVTLDALVPGHVLAADLEAAGSRLLTEGTKLNAPLIARLRDLESLKDLIEDIWVVKEDETVEE